jgi:putative PIN family toxin of toxin-antitoxin system
MVFLQAAVSRRGPAFALLTLAEAGRLELLVSSEILSELREVLFRPTVQRKFPLLTSELIDAFLARLATFTILVEHVPNVIRLSRDSDDEAYLNLALAGQAQYLVTRDHDLLDLAAGELLRAHLEMKVIDPAAFLKELANESE